MQTFTIWRLRRRRRKLASKFSKLLERAKNGNECQELLTEASDAQNELDDQLLHLQTQRLIHKAQDLGIPYPSYASQRDSWQDGREPNTVRLKPDAQVALLKAIREEQREKWSVMAFVLKEIVTPIIGVLGAIMGLLSLIHAFRSK